MTYRLIFLGEEVTSQRKRHLFFAQVLKNTKVHGLNQLQQPQRPAAGASATKTMQLITDR